MSNKEEVVEEKQESSQEQAPEGESNNTVSDDVIDDDVLTKLLDEIESLRKEKARLESSRASQQERLKRILLGGNSTSGETGKTIDSSKEPIKDTSDNEVDYSYLDRDIKFF